MPDDYTEEREIVNRRGSEVFKHEKHEISEIYEKKFKPHAETRRCGGCTQSILGEPGTLVPGLRTSLAVQY